MVNRTRFTQGKRNTRRIWRVEDALGCRLAAAWEIRCALAQLKHGSSQGVEQSLRRAIGALARQKRYLKREREEAAPPATGKWRGEQ